MIRTRRGLMAIMILTLLVGLVVKFPARVALDMFAPPSVATAGINGTIWSGSVQEVAVEGIYLRQLSWKLRPLSLFGGNLSYDLKATPPSGFIESEVDLGFGGDLEVRNLKASLPLAMVSAAVDGIPLRGKANMAFERLQVVDGVPIAADGSIDISNIVVPLVGQQSLGSYRAEFFTQNNGITASVEDTDAVVDLAGTLQIRPDRSYELVALFQATGQTPAELRRMISYAPVVNERGQREHRESGTF